MTAFDATPCEECMAGPGVPCGPGCTALWGVLNGIEDASSADAVTRVRPAGPCTACQVVPGSHAGLHVGHVWTERACPAYRTLDGADCTCLTP